MKDSRGKEVKVFSIEWQKGKFSVYNLEIEKYHTYFAQGEWVHNQKGGQRSIFKDTAYWNPQIHTDLSGRAQIIFKLPDNLTTWTLSALGATSDTKVGQTTKDITVTKDIIIRPILPNILRVDDEIVLSALVQNFTQTDESMDITLTFTGADIKQATYSSVLIKSNQTKQFFWQTKPLAANQSGRLTFSAISQNNMRTADSMTVTLPVITFGFGQKRAETAIADKDYFVRLSADADKQKSTVTLALSSTLLGTMSLAMQYLISYPYGCVEQTTSRLVPAVIAKSNQSLFAEALYGKNIDEIIEKGIQRLALLQQPDGGWTWWFSGKSDSFITSYVLEYLIYAQQLGIPVDSEIISKAKYYFQWVDKAKTREDNIAKAYALAILEPATQHNPITNFDGLTADFLSLAVMSNFRNGDRNPSTNGLTKLLSLAKQQGDTLYWDAGLKQNFGSKDASTAWAIRAILTAGGNRDMAARAVRYLTQVRKSEYWSNTYATAQVINALVEFSHTGSETNPNYSYTVTLDGKKIASGTILSNNQPIPEIVIPIHEIKLEGSTLSVIKTGEGQLYSTLLFDEFHTDKNIKSLSHGLSITRAYENAEAGKDSLAVGDTAIVKLIVSGLDDEEHYGVIADELPAGLIPINETLKNEEYGDASGEPYLYGFADKEVTQNGMVLSLYKVGTGQRSYTYRARVISEGNFIVPPSIVTLMYAPEIYARSQADTIQIGKPSESEDVRIPTFTQKYAADKIHIPVDKIYLLGVLAVLTLAGLGVFIKKVSKTNRK